MKEDMLKPRGFFNQSDNSVLVKDYKNRNEKLLLLKKILKIYYLRSITCATIPIDKISPGVYCHQYVYRR
jgi:hypothetical protein